MLGKRSSKVKEVLIKKKEKITTRVKNTLSKIQNKDALDEIPGSQDEIQTRQFTKEVIWLWKDLIIIILIVMFIRTFIMLPFQIKGPSMLDSYYDKEFIIVDRFTYLDIPLIKKWAINRGDVIVFKPHVSTDKEFFIKRIIGFPWDTIKIEWGVVSIFNKTTQKFVQIDEQYLSDSNKWHTYVSGLDEATIYNVPEGEYFVMGDNRLASTDSRSCFSSCAIPNRSNFIPQSYIVWRVWLDLWYFNVKKFNFVHPELGITTNPRFFDSPSHYTYSNLDN